MKWPWLMVSTLITTFTASACRSPRLAPKWNLWLLGADHDARHRKKRWEQLDDDFSYDPNQLDRDVVAPDQIRKIIQTYRDRLFTEIFPGRSWAPKTIIFAKDDAHAENIVEIVREEFGKDNDFAQKITYRSYGSTTCAPICILPSKQTR